MKILVIYATAGAGHRKAAEAVHHSLRTICPADQVELVDVLDYTSRWYKFLYNETYTFLVGHLPWVWGFFFRLLEFRWMVPLMHGWRRIYNIANSRRLATYLIEQDFDCIVSTHFFPGEVAGNLKRRGKIRSRIIMVVTDFDVHPIWIADNVDLYTAATEWTRNKLLKLGVEDSRVIITGIPTHSKFSVVRDKEALNRRLGIGTGNYKVLLATGSFGFGPIEKIIERIDGTETLVVCGHNKELFERLKTKNQPGVRVFGLINNMEELMGVADVMLTKPGGLSIAEALVSGLPLIFFNAIPGQETNNVRVLQQYGVGYQALQLEDIVEQISRLRSSQELSSRAKEKSLALARPSAANDIVGLVKRPL